MLTINTTFFVSTSYLDVFLSWIKQQYIPQMLETKQFVSPRFCQILSNQADDTESFSLQFDLISEHTREEWELVFQEKTQKELQLLFNEHVLIFSTVFKQLDI